MSVGALSRGDCPNDGPAALFRAGRCVHCGAQLTASPVIPVKFNPALVTPRPHAKEETKPFPRATREASPARRRVYVPRPKREGFTENEAHVVRHLAAGITNHVHIGQALDITPQYVGQIIAAACGKLGLKLEPRCRDYSVLIATARVRGFLAVGEVAA